MKIVHTQSLDWHHNALPHRAGTISFKYLLDGEEGSPENFTMVLADEKADFLSPRHKHPWDQIRYCLSGSVPIGPRQTIEAGEIGYFPEGVSYGPQEGPKDRVVVVLQFGGASGNGFLSEAEIERGRAELKKVGRFEKGVFKRERGEGRKNQDGYEAVWEQVRGEKLTYPAPRFRDPLIMQPDGFAASEIAPGVRRRSLGLLTERHVEISFYDIAAGAKARLDAPGDGDIIVFVGHGGGRLDGDVYEEYAVARLEPGESTGFAAETETRLLAVVLPRLAAGRHSAESARSVAAE